jgi:hypothetical protein
LAVGLTCLTMTTTNARKKALRVPSTSWHQHWTSIPTPGCGPSAVENTSLSS